MEQDKVCEKCKVSISSDLTNCPLCGRHIIKHEDRVELNKNSYPLYDLKFVETAKWYNIIRVVFWLAGIICVLVNLYFKTTPYWFPYVLAGLVMVFHVFIEPIKRKISSYLKSLTIMSIFVALFLIFVDAYNYYSFNVAFGWAYGYAAPLTMLASVLASTIICFCSKKYEVELLRSVVLQMVVSIIYFLVKILAFKDVVAWPSLAFICTSIGVVVILELFKRNKLIKELSKEFHI